MLFNSWSFLPFLAIVLALYYVLPHRAQSWMLLVASYIFYGAWDWRFAGLLLLTSSLDYWLAHAIQRQVIERRRKALLLISLFANFGILGFFKYFNFFTESLAQLLSVIGFSPDWPTLNIILPVGISFYTFQSMSYTIDVYRKEVVPLHDYLGFILYISFFPQMVAGPIMRANDLLPQLINKRYVTRDKILSGLWLLLLGFFKKVVVADNLAIYVNDIFGSTDPTTGPQCLLAIYAFAFQIYGDFSGYSDIARGLGKLMGVEVMVNFNLPYRARNPSDFWRRWHISLSTWIRDYLYIPMGGNKGTPWQTYRNLIATMLLGGLWHGAAWRFVIWGGYHGVLLALHRFFFRERRAPQELSGWKQFLSIVGMFHLTCFGWLLFRAADMRQVGQFIHAILFDFRGFWQTTPLLFALLLYGGLLWLVELCVGDMDDPRSHPGWSYGFGCVIVTGLVMSLFLLSAPAGHSFIYFQF